MGGHLSRRTFIVHAGTAGAALAGAAALATQAQTTTHKEKIQSMTDNKQLLVAADPYAVSLKESVVAHLKEKGYDVTDLGSVAGKDIPYYDGASAVCKAIQAGKAPRAILFCGTGMGMSIVANRYKGVTASVVESVFAAKMCRAINNANVLCLGQMIWGQDMAKAAVDTFLTTQFTEGFEGISGFLHDACCKVEAIRP
jgi:ribose 5-phosphate isomerase B